MEDVFDSCVAWSTLKTNTLASTLSERCRILSVQLCIPTYTKIFFSHVLFSRANVSTFNVGFVAEDALFVSFCFFDWVYVYH